MPYESLHKEPDARAGASRSPKRFRARILALLFPVTFATSAIAQDSALEPHTFQEGLNPMLDVAGDVRKGVLGTDPNAPIDLEAFFVWLPGLAERGGFSSTLCVEIDSQDGIYHAELAFDIASRTGPTRLRITNTRQGQTKHADRLAGYRAGEFGVLAYLPRGRSDAAEGESQTGGAAGVPCKTRASTYLAVGWGENPALSSDLYVQINSHDMKASIAVADTGPIGECKRITRSERPTKTFDRICKIPRSAALSDLTIQRRHFRRRETPVQLPIVVP